MVFALLVGILLVIRKRRKRQKARGLAQSSTKAHLSTGSNPASLDEISLESKERPHYAYPPSTPPGPPQPAPRVDNRGKKAQSRRAMSPPGVPPLPAPDPERPLPPMIFRQPEVPMIIVSPRPRGSSLSHASRPALAIPPPAWRRHLTSVSEDIRPVSRFSISPVSPSFPYRLPGNSPPGVYGTSRVRYTRLPGVGSLSSLGLLRSETTPDVPTDVSD